jgi:hypothetical protein
MAQFYTLEEAAGRLQIGPDEFRRRLKTEWTAIRPFRDGPTLRFRAADIDELARSLGAASDTGLPLGPVGSPMAEESGDYAALPTDKPAARRPADEPLGLGGEDIYVSPESGHGKPKVKGDSDVRLDVSKPQQGSDPESHLPTEEIALDLSGPASGTLKSPSSGKLQAPKSGPKLTSDSGKVSGPTGKKEETDSSSEFELSLDSDSDSFELQLSADSSEEVDIGAPGGGDPKSGHSGINLGKPSDSGVSLEKKGPKTDPLAKGKKPAETDSDSDVDFELSLDPTGSSAARMTGPRSGPPKSGPPKSGPPKSGPRKPPPSAEDSSSEFELTLDDSSGVSERLADNLRAEEGKGDIFETDFELPVMPDESGSEVVPVESSDTDLDSTGFDVDAADDVPVDDESASEVVMVDEDAPLIEDDSPVSLHDEDALDAAALDESASASQALRGVRAGEAGEVRTVVAAPPKWGPIPAVGLALTLIPAFLGMLMTFEILRGMWGYSPGGGAGGMLVRGVADTFGMKVND